MRPNFRIHLTLNGETSTATSLTLGAAEAVVRAFEVEHAGNKEALAEIRELDGSILGTRVYSWWGGARVGPKDARHPMQALMQRAIRAGCRVVVGDCDRGVVEIAPGSIAA